MRLATNNSMKRLSTWIALTMIVFTATGQDLQRPVVRVKADAPTYLYGGQASRMEGDLKKQGGDNFSWKGRGRATWEVQVDKSGEYAVGLCHAAAPGSAGHQLEIAGGANRIGYTLRVTKGVFPDNMAYEMVPISGSLQLKAGKQTISLSISNAPAEKPVLAFRSLELIPIAATQAIEAEKTEARRSRANTEWLVKAGYGLMFHWTSQSIGKDGAIKPFGQAVADFPRLPACQKRCFQCDPAAVSAVLALVKLMPGNQQSNKSNN